MLSKYTQKLSHINLQRKSQTQKKEEEKTDQVFDIFILPFASFLLSKVRQGEDLLALPLVDRTIAAECTLLVQNAPDALLEAKSDTEQPQAQQELFRSNQDFWKQKRQKSLAYLMQSESRIEYQKVAEVHCEEDESADDNSNGRKMAYVDGLIAVVFQPDRESSKK